MDELEPIDRSDDFRRCYGCGPDNERGLRLDFRRDPARRRVVARWVPPDHLGGFGRIVHGGAISTALDEAMGWALWGLTGGLGVTRELTVRFLRPVLVRREMTVVGWLAGQEGRTTRILAELRDARDRVAASAEGTFVAISADRVRDDAGESPAGARSAPDPPKTGVKRTGDGPGRSYARHRPCS